MRHYQDSPIGMALDDALHGVERPVAMRFSRLAFELDVEPLVRGQPFPVPPVLLAQVGIHDDREAELLAEDLRGLAGAGQVARVDRVDVVVGEPVGEGLRLPAPVGVQRTIGVTLQLPLGIPIGLAVANEQQLRHLQLG